MKNQDRPAGMYLFHTVDPVFQPLAIARLCRAVLVAVFLMGSMAQAQLVIDDPIAYWDFSDANILSNRVISSPFHDATILCGQPQQGVAGNAEGIVGNALLLDGASAIQLPYHQDLLGRSFTIAVWYWQATNDTRMAVYQTPDTFDITYETTGNNSIFQSYVGQSAVGTITSDLQTWIHLVHTFTTREDKTTLNVYTNGVLEKTKTVNSNAVFDTCRITALNVGANRSIQRHFKGMLDEVALWSRPLSEAEVAALYQRGQSGQPLAVTTQPPPCLSMDGKIRQFELTNTWPTKPGVYQSGWLLNAGSQMLFPMRIFDTASRLDDTASHPDGPFHAEPTTFNRLRAPLAANGLGQITQGDFTIEARFRTRDNERGILLGNYQNHSMCALNLELAYGNIVRLYVQPYTTGRSTVNLLGTPLTGTNIRDGGWHHLAGTRAGSTLTLWLDGVPLATAADTAGAYALTGPHFFMKGDTRTDITLFNGDIEDARLWTRSLNAAEVSSLASGVQPGGAEIARSALLAEYAGSYSPHNAEYAAPKYRTPLVTPLTRLTRGDFTVESWFRTTDPERGVIMGNHFSGTAGRAVNLELATPNQVRLYVQNSPTVVNVYAPGGASRDGGWHHLAGLRRSGQLYLFLDGKQVGTAADTTGSFDLNGSHYYFGRDSRTGLTEFDGDFKDARMWSRALDNSEITALAAGARPGAPDVAINNLMAEYTHYRPTNSLYTAGLTSDYFFRTSVTGVNTLTLVFEELPRHTAIALGAFVAQLESLDPTRDNDCFIIRVDGEEVLKVGLGFGTASHYSEPEVASLELFGEPADPQLFAATLTVGGEELFDGGAEPNGYNEHVYDLSRLEALQNIPHRSKTLQIEIIGIHNQDYKTEGFGLDRIQLTVLPVKGTLLLLN
ncbi:MAG: LamG domain-containing protein [Kiritimatiellae bacterium]|nr:LamG domain-containing protein [Kiritimatiellia bacterium]